MSLGHLEAIPVDTHIYQIAARLYLPELKKQKTVTDKIYNEIGEHFRSLYGPLAGWAHTVSIFFNQLLIITTSFLDIILCRFKNIPNYRKPRCEEIKNKKAQIELMFALSFKNNICILIEEYIFLPIVMLHFDSVLQFSLFVL